MTNLIKTRRWTGWAVAASLIAVAPALAQGPRLDGGPRTGVQPGTSGNPVSPVRNITRSSEGAGRDRRAPSDGDTRTIDGSSNNRLDAEVGTAGTQLIRLVASDYGDGVSSLAGAGRPSARAVSNAVCRQDEDMPNSLGVSDYLWQWGQFVDHDIDLTDGADPAEAADIAIPEGDAWFDPSGSGTVVMAFNRSLYDAATGDSSGNPRQQLNEITAWIDGSNVYGSDHERAAALRTLDGTGRLRMSEGRLLPFNTDGLPNAGGTSDTLFLAGDVRANEQVGLMSMHVLFVREHNRLVREFAAEDPRLSGEQLYQRARRIVGAQLQVITYDEYLPALLGSGALPPYQGYSGNLDAGVANLFSTAAYRYGHSSLSATLLRLDAEGEEIAEGHLPLRDAFFNPALLTAEGGIEPILRGLASQVCQDVDPRIVDEVRNFLFGPPGSGGFDLAALNIQRGRDHGLPSYNDTRRALGMRPARRFEDISSDVSIVADLASVHASVEDVDVWVGGLAEDSLPGALVGPLVARVVADQFARLRDGDRFWYQRSLGGRELDEVERTRLSDIIKRNTTIGDELPDDVFHVSSRERPPRRGGRP